MILPILFFQIIFPITAQENDFLIVENPHAYTILNKYEQPATEKEKELFLPFSPFQIINEDETLGDEITNALKFRFDQSIYFLLKDDDGNYIGDKKNKYRHNFKNCKVVEDTIRILGNRAILLANKYPSQGKRVYLNNGDMVTRVFKYGDYYYVKRTGSKERYGWCSLSSRNVWQSIEKTQYKKEDYIFKPNLRDRIISQLKSVNEAYRKYFDHFNKITGQQKSIPKWQYTVDADIIRCTLTGTYSYPTQLEESTYYLVQDLENMLLGKPFTVDYQNGKIVIKAKNK